MFCAASLTTLLAVASAGVPDRAPSYPAVRISKAPVIDGVVNLDEWAEAATFTGLVNSDSGQPCPEPSQFWIAYDDKNVYFAARMDDHQPGSIHATEYRTNVQFPGDDFVELDLDLSGSLRDFGVFLANPRGATRAVLPGGRALKREWAGEIVAKSRVTATGWESEMRIPWSILPIPGKGKRDVRFNVGRFIARLNQAYSHSYVIPGHEQVTPYWRGVMLPSPYVDHHLLMLPYGYAGYDRESGVIADAGLDFKTQLAQQVNLVGTINPDFRNVENGILSLDFSRFERIVAETRPFFLEGQRYMNTALFASQRIGHFDAGINTYGKLSDTSQFGLIDTIDFGRENDTAVNLSYDPNPNDSYRVTATSLTQPGLDNNAYMARYNRQFGPVSLFLRDMGSQDTAVGWGENSTAQVGYYKDGLQGSLAYTRVTPNFNPRLGFFPETDFRGYDAFVSYYRPMPHGPLLTWNASLYDTDYAHADGSPYRRDNGGSVDLLFRNKVGFGVAADRANFEGSHDRLDAVHVAYPATDPLRQMSVDYQVGEFQSIPYRSLALHWNLRPVRTLQISSWLQEVRYDTVQEQAIVGASYDLGRDRSIAGRAVLNQGKTNFYLAYRRSGNRGAEYYVILGDPNAPTFRTSLLVKAVFPFRV